MMSHVVYKDERKQCFQFLFTYINLFLSIIFSLSVWFIFKQFIACCSVMQYVWYTTVHNVLFDIMFTIICEEKLFIHTVT